MDILIHVAIAGFGLSSIYFHQKRNDYVPSVLGLLFMLFAIYSCVESEQWGILVLCSVYTYAWFMELFSKVLQLRKQQLGWSYDELINDELPKDILNALHKSKGVKHDRR